SYFVPTVQEEAWNILGLSTGVLQLALTQADRHIGEIEQTFFMVMNGEGVVYGRGRKHPHQTALRP
ncbi:hypothetical protein DPQ33_19480, partial [Oceanidesulfovibrio indonesiensis]